MRRFAASFFAFAFLIFATAGTGNAQEIEVGFAKTSLVTNQSGVPLGGYGGRGLIPLHAVHDPVYVKAMVIKNGDQAVAMVTFDLIGVQRTILEGLEKRGFPEHVKLNANRDLLLSASHTHAGYGGLAKSTGAWYLDGLFFVTCGPYNQKFFDEVLTKVQQTIVDAWDDLAPARIGIASEEIDGLSRNRGRGGDVTDKELGVIKVTDPKGKLRGLLINFTAHPTILGVENLRLSGGYPGALQRILEERYEGSTVLFTNGAEGDISVSSPSGEYKTPWEKMDACGLRLANHVDRIQKATETVAALEIHSEGKDLTFPKPKVLKQRLKYTGGQKKSLFHQIVLGDTLLMGIPGEPCCRIGLDLKAAAKKRGFRKAWVIGLAQDHCGYFVHRHDYQPQYEESHDYEKGLNFYGPGVGEFFLDVHMKKFDPKPLPTR